jgi:hypothetical protein
VETHEAENEGQGKEGEVEQAPDASVVTPDRLHPEGVDAVGDTLEPELLCVELDAATDALLIFLLLQSGLALLLTAVEAAEGEDDVADEEDTDDSGDGVLCRRRRRSKKKAKEAEEGQPARR